MLSPGSRGSDGFTLAELLAAVTILAIGVLGLATGAGRMMTTAESSQRKATALQAADDRLAAIRMSPGYAALDSIYEGEEDAVPGIPGCTRTTDVGRVVSNGESGRILDYTRITVTVACQNLGTPVVRTLIVGAP